MVPDPGPGEARRRRRAPAGSATPTSTTARGRSTTISPSSSATKPPARSRRSGEGVTNVAPGDYVVLAWRAPCGLCRSCRRGRPWYCFDSANAAQPMTLPDGTPLSPALGIGAFAEKTLVAAGQAVKIDPGRPPGGRRA